ncbi:hypothetical protein SEMRO_141_G065710.1 [Seminavis robusta]|uniref:Uncharacterized protein n=1 Tax=Seminavis robusta TaxID=568900 RepID=A0A9N8DL78_9STRA|nr:hypothetical protein SEMRO_141_G065710.1 [Seminavis robusta]|eukprot:Sro141_g065710.1 n/a (305) ;mRNA; r:10384-11417
MTTPSDQKEDSKPQDDTCTETKLQEENYPDEDGIIPEEGAMVVAMGRHVVPAGVAVEELKNYAGEKDLKNLCPDSVLDMLTHKNLLHVYAKFVDSVVADRSTRGPLGKWKDAQFISVIDLFRDDFAKQGVKVALCKRCSGSGTFRWLEFIDRMVASDYVPQFDVANRSGQVITTVKYRLKFPNGVAVEELKQIFGRKQLKEKIPVHVEKMLQDHNLMEEYHQLVDHCIKEGSVNLRWNVDKLREIMATHQPMFAKKGVDIFVSHKDEYVFDLFGGQTYYYRWIEFVDRKKQPNYRPQRAAESNV